MKFFNSPRIVLEKVDLGEIKVSIPVADFKSETPGPIVVITGGMDGDEYTSIQAAYNLIGFYSQHQFVGRIVILPLMNLPGFFFGKSINTQDNKYPKYIFPGNSSGTSSERLIDWLNKKYLVNANVWIDLHSGAITENLNPFVWAFETKNEVVNDYTKSILSNINCQTKIYQKHPFFSKPEKLAFQNCSYLMFECGERGDQNLVDIKRLVSWVKQSIKSLESKPEKKQFTHYREIMIYKSNKPGLWELYSSSASIEKGDTVGEITDLNKKKLQKIKIKKSGIVLWSRSALFVNIGEELIAIASDKRSV